MTGHNPTVHLTVGRNRRTRYGADQYRLRGGEEYELELHNPTTGTVGARVTVDGRPLGGTVIVLRPGERAYVERWIDEARRLRFDTYAVDDTAGNRSAIAGNGAVTAEFLRERAAPPSWMGQTITTSAGWTPRTTPLGGFSYYAATNSIGLADGVGIEPASDNLRSFDAVVGDAQPRSGKLKRATRFSGTVATPEVLTGRTERGSASGQQFQQVHVDFESHAFHTERFVIMPLEAEEAADALKRYCAGCGTRARRSNWKWCPNCGARI